MTVLAASWVQRPGKVTKRCFLASRSRSSWKISAVLVLRIKGWLGGNFKMPLEGPVNEKVILLFLRSSMALRRDGRGAHQTLSRLI